MTADSRQKAGKQGVKTHEAPTIDESETRYRILASSKEGQDIVGSYLNGANSFVRKSLDFRQSTEAIKYLGPYWLALNEPPPPGATAANG